MKELKYLILIWLNRQQSKFICLHKRQKVGIYSYRSVLPIKIPAHSIVGTMSMFGISLNTWE